MTSIAENTVNETALSNEAPRNASGELSRRTKISYGMGDFGNNIVWQMLSIWLAIFYTDVFGLHATHVGTMYLLVRIFDAVTDPLVGYWVDRTRTRWGSCRPFIFLGAIPLALSFSMVFYTPDLGETGKLIYAYGSFALLSLTYTLVNVPFSSMAGFLTRDSDERTVLQSYRFGLGMLASVVVSFFLVPMVDLFGQGDKQQGYFISAIVFAVMIVACLYYCAFSVKERYSAEPLNAEQQAGIGDLISDIKLAFANRELVILFAANILFFITLTVKGTAAAYYVNEVLVDADDKIGLFFTFGSIGATLGAAMAAFLWTRFDKVRAYKVLMIVCAGLSAAPYWMPGTEFTAILALGVIVSFLSISMVPLTWSMLSDLVDYQKVLVGRDMAGIFFALFLFTLKVGLGVGGAIALWVIGETGYVAGLETQTTAVVNSINFVGTLLPGLMFLLAGGIMKFYSLDRARREEINIQLYGQVND